MTNPPIAVAIAHLDRATVTAVFFAQAADTRCETEDGEKDDDADANCGGVIYTWGEGTGMS
jgi:hypothetical protein